MANAKTLETPTDSPEAPVPANAGTRPSSANRYRLFDDEGDYRIYEIAKTDSGLPKGSLLPIAEIPGFMTGNAARKWVNNSGNILDGKQFLILKGLEIGNSNVETVTTARIKWKPKTAVSGPAALEAEGA